jgi:MFS family permease
MTRIVAPPDSAGTPPPTAARDPYAVLRNRDVALYLMGRLVASLGQQMLTVAVGWELYERTHSALALGLVGLTQTTPMVLFTLPAGHVADNHDRKRIIVLMSLILACASLGLSLISALGAHVFWTYFCLFAAGTARTFLWPASSAFLPQLVSRQDFSRAVAWSSGSFQLSSVAGPAAGGALIALTHHAAPVYAVNAAAALICLTLISFVRRRHTAAAKEKMTAQSLIVGFKFVFTSPIILGTITLDLFAVLLGGATALLPVYAKDILAVGPTGLGFLQAALPMGSLVCARCWRTGRRCRKPGGRCSWRSQGSGWPRLPLAAHAGSGSPCSCSSRAGRWTTSASLCGTRWCNCSRPMKSAGASPPSTASLSAPRTSWADSSPDWWPIGSARLSPSSPAGWGPFWWCSRWRSSGREFGSMGGWMRRVAPALKRETGFGTPERNGQELLMLHK